MLKIIALAGSLANMFSTNKTAPTSNRGSKMLKPSEQRTLDRAAKILERIMANAPDTHITSPAHARNILIHRLNGKNHEEFHVLFLDASHGLIEAKTMAIGTINQAAIYPRELIKHALAIGAQALILGHNHPSGSLNPSESDKRITKAIQDAAAMFEISVLDHLIIGHGTQSLSFAESRLM